MGNLPPDGRLLFVTRFIRLFSYGSLSVVLVFYLSSLGLNEAQTGLLLTLTLLGDTVISLGLTTQADRIGRRRMLIIGSVLMAGAGLAFAGTRNFLFLVAAGTIGVISPSGNEVGPFLPIEQAALSHVVPARERTTVFAWYALAGALATATGSLFAGVVTQALQKAAAPVLSSERTIIVFYAAMGVLLGLLFHRLSPAAEVRQEDGLASGPRTLLGIGASRRVVLSLCEPFCTGCVRRRVHRAELRGLLVLPSLRSRPGNAGRHFLWRQCSRRTFSAGGPAAGSAVRAGQDHGVHAPAFEHSADADTADAESAARGAARFSCDSASARWMCRPGNRTPWPSCAPTSGLPRRESPGWRGPPARRWLPCLPGFCLRTLQLINLPFYHRRHTQDRLRPAALQGFRARRAA